MSDKMRAEFEAAFPLPPGVYWGGKSYLYTSGVAYSLTNAIKWDVRWETWQASRAALVVELPDASRYDGHQARLALHESREALEALGLQVAK